MFERYTERARRILFFARFEASEFGAQSIEADHILLGLLRESSGLIVRILGAAGLTVDAVRGEVVQRVTPREKTATSVEIPFTPAAKRILNLAAEEAIGLGDGHIGHEHILLGILREGSSTAGTTLAHLNIESVRKQVVEMRHEPEVEVSVGWGSDPINRIKWLVDELARTDATTARGRQLLDAIHALLDALKRRPPPG